MTFMVAKSVTDQAININIIVELLVPVLRSMRIGCSNDIEKSTAPKLYLGASFGITPYRFAVSITESSARPPTKSKDTCDTLGRTLGMLLQLQDAS